MSRITDKTIRPLPIPGDNKVQEQPRQREIPVPPGARVVSTALSALQRADNQRLIAVYHLLKEKKTSESASQDFEARLKGWKKRPNAKKKRDGEQAGDDSQSQENEQESEQESEPDADGNKGQQKEG